MGAATFLTRAKGKTAQDAFVRAREAAQWDHGHSGYTGTIAEKQAFTMITPPLDCENVEQFAYDLIDKADPRINDKWGPAGCIKLTNGEWLFFGWASS